MNKTYSYMVNVTFYDRAIHQEFFITEKEAREYANRCYKMDNTKRIELLHHRKYGYEIVKAIHRHHKNSTLWLERKPT